MNINGKHYRTIWLKEGDESVVQIIDQRHLPHRFIIEDLCTVDEVAVAIKDMLVRGAGLIGATAAYGMYIAARHIAQAAPDDETFTAQLTPAAEQ
jgi:methylthioribose-1-phosphate isomerase